MKAGGKGSGRLDWRVGGSGEGRLDWRLGWAGCKSNLGWWFEGKGNGDIVIKW